MKQIVFLLIMVLCAASPFAFAEDGNFIPGVNPGGNWACFPEGVQTPSKYVMADFLGTHEECLEYASEQIAIAAGEAIPAESTELQSGF